MRRLTEAWFEFAGVDSRDMGILIRQMPIRYQPGRNYTHKKVSGRNGTTRLGDGSYNDVTVRIECDLHDASRMADVAAWLTGDGFLRFSDEPDMMYSASIEKEFSRASIIPRMAGQRFTVLWTCHPYRYIYPEAAVITVSASDPVVSNPGTAPSDPMYKITGSGDFSVTVNGDVLYFTDITDGIIVDAELMDALTYDGALLANDKMSGKPPQLLPGLNVVSWSGNVSKIEITPRWRCI